MLWPAGDLKTKGNLYPSNITKVGLSKYRPQSLTSVKFIFRSISSKKIFAVLMPRRLLTMKILWLRENLMLVYAKWNGPRQTAQLTQWLRQVTFFNAVLLPTPITLHHRWAIVLQLVIVSIPPTIFYTKNKMWGDCYCPLWHLLGMKYARSTLVWVYCTKKENHRLFNSMF